MLQLQSISKNFGHLKILKEITLDFPAQSLTVLGGANGSGKSTLLKILAGLMPPSSGSILINYPLEAKFKTLAYVGHPTFIYPQLTALENLNFWQKAYHLGLSLEDLEDLLNQFGLLAFADQYPRLFSRGMAQKLNLARALMLNPAICLLDEPETGLDNSAKDFLQQKLLQLKNQGACVIFISHDLEKALSFADQGYYLKEGKLSPLKRETYAQ